VSGHAFRRAVSSLQHTAGFSRCAARRVLPSGWKPAPCVTQYLDTMKEIGAHDHSNTIRMSHSPGAVTDLFRQMQDAVMIGTKAANPAP
jgi:hypothetical protein